MFARALRAVGLLTMSIAVLLACPLSAQGQGKPAAPTKSAVELAGEAKAHYDRGEWEPALELFLQAESATHSPVIVLYAARCHRNLGHLLEARELLQKAASEALDADASAPFVQAKKDAQGDLDALAGRIPTLTLIMSDGAKSWSVSVDGKPTTALSHELNPGPHVVTAHDGSEQRFRKPVELAEGDTITVTIEATDHARPPDPPPPPPSDHLALVPGLALIGAGAIALGVGIGFRVSAIQRVEDVKDRCTDAGSCLREDEDVVESAVAEQNISTVLFAAGGALAAAGVVLLIVLPSDDDTTQTSLMLSPMGIGLTTSF